MRDKISLLVLSVFCLLLIPIDVEAANPRATILINNYTEFTNSLNVTLYLNCNGTTGPYMMQFRNDNNNTWTGYENLSSTKQWTLRNLDGRRTVYMQCNDSNGKDDTDSEDIELDRIPPKIGFNLTTLINNTFINNNTIYAKVDVAEDNLADVTFFLLNNSTIINQTIAKKNKYDITWAVDPNLEYYFYVRAKDNASNVNITETRKITIDLIKPNYTGIINSDRLNKGDIFNITINAFDFFGVSNITVIIKRFNYTNISITESSSANILWNASAKGVYLIDVVIADLAGNILISNRSFVIAVNENNESIKSIWNGNITGKVNEKNYIASKEASALFDLELTDNINGSFTLVYFTDNPSDKNLTGKGGAGKYIEIEPESMVKEKVKNVFIKINYTDDEISKIKLDEMSLRIYYYNETSGNWEIFDDLNGGVNITGNYVWANSTHLSLYSIFGNYALNNLILSNDNPKGSIIHIPVPRINFSQFDPSGLIEPSNAKKEPKSQIKKPNTNSDKTNVVTSNKVEDEKSLPLYGLAVLGNLLANGIKPINVILIIIIITLIIVILFYYKKIRFP